jgi:hypothetical protein
MVLVSIRMVGRHINDYLLKIFSTWTLRKLLKPFLRAKRSRQPSLKSKVVKPSEKNWTQPIQAETKPLALVWIVQLEIKNLAAVAGMTVAKVAGVQVAAKVIELQVLRCHRNVHLGSPVHRLLKPLSLQQRTTFSWLPVCAPCLSKPPPSIRPNETIAVVHL